MPVLLRGQKRFEEMGDYIRRNSCAVVPDFDHQLRRAFAQPGTEPEISSARHGIVSVHDQRQDHLFDLCGIALHPRQARRQVQMQLHASHLELVLTSRTLRSTTTFRSVV